MAPPRREEGRKRCGGGIENTQNQQNQNKTIGGSRIKGPSNIIRKSYTNKRKHTHDNSKWKIKPVKMTITNHENSDNNKPRRASTPHLRTSVIPVPPHVYHEPSNTIGTSHVSATKINWRSMARQPIQADQPANEPSSKLKSAAQSTNKEYQTLYDASKPNTMWNAQTCTKGHGRRNPAAQQ